METVMANNHLIKADIFRILSKGFSYADENSVADIKKIISELTEHNEINVEYSQYLVKILKHTTFSDILKEYSRLFMKGTVPTTESSCCGKLHSITDASAFYKAFGMKAKSGNSPDAISYQLEFVSLLMVKMAIAKEEENFELAEDAYKKFLKDHLIEFVGKFHDKLNEAHPIEFYKYLSDLLIHLIQDESELYNLKTVKQ